MLEVGSAADWISPELVSEQNNIIFAATSKHRPATDDPPLLSHLEKLLPTAKLVNASTFATSHLSKATEFSEMECCILDVKERGHLSS